MIKKCKRFQVNLVSTHWVELSSAQSSLVLAVRSTVGSFHLDWHHYRDRFYAFELFHKFWSLGPKSTTLPNNQTGREFKMAFWTIISNCRDNSLKIKISQKNSQTGGRCRIILPRGTGSVWLQLKTRRSGKPKFPARRLPTMVGLVIGSRWFNKEQLEMQELCAF